MPDLAEQTVEIDFDSIAKKMHKRNGNKMPFWLYSQCPTLCDYETDHGPSQTRHWKQHLGIARDGSYAPSRRLQAWDVYGGDAIKCSRGGFTDFWNVVSADVIGDADSDDCKMFFIISHPNNDLYTDNILCRWDKELTVKQYSLPPSKR